MTVLVERHYIRGTAEIIRLCENSCLLWNRCNVILRAAFLGGRKFPSMNQLVKRVEKEDYYKNLHNTKTAKQTIRLCLEDWSNFFKSLAAYKKDKSKYKKRPHPPGYKKFLAQVIFYNETIIGGRSGKQLDYLEPTNHCLGIPTKVKEFKQLKITPKKWGFVAEVSYDPDVQPKTEEERKEGEKKKLQLPAKGGYCCIDLGLDNLCAITSDQHVPLLINGRPLKSINQWFNKNRCPKRNRKRYWLIENYFHHVSKFLIDVCLYFGNHTIVIGKNDGWKQKSKLGKRNNQNFQYISFGKLIEKIQYKAKLAKIHVIVTEESYTSKASFIDRDPIPAYDPDVVSPKMSGKRIKRGLYRTKNGLLVNADINGSANIGRKVILDKRVLLRLDRSLAVRPVRINPLLSSERGFGEWILKANEV